MQNRKPYFTEQDFNTVKDFQTALNSLWLPRKSDPEEHQRRSEIAAEIIENLKKDIPLSHQDKIAMFNIAIAHYIFASRKLGSLKRGLNSLFSRGDTTANNYDPYFRSSSQEMLITARDEMEKTYHKDTERCHFKVTI